MKIVLPVAGFGKRMRPHTWSKPKPLVNVAGKPVLGHLLDRFKAIDIEEVIFIIGWLGDQIEAYVNANYDFAARYVVQKELKGQAHAIYLAKDYLTGPCIILWVDTLFEADLQSLEGRQEDGVAYVQEVEDPRRFGVAVEEEGRIVRLIEKPDSFEHRNAVIGLYYIKDSAALVDAIENLLRQDIQTKGEYYLVDALQIMIDRGAVFVSEAAPVWRDCGTPEALLDTNRYLLDRGCTQVIETENGVLVPPVWVATSASIVNSVVGPYATVCDGVHIANSIVRDAIIEEGSAIENVGLEHSLIGRNAAIKGSLGRLNVGDDNKIIL